MISAFTNTWRVPELRDRILFTLAMVVIVRLGVAVTIPGVDAMCSVMMKNLIKKKGVASIDDLREAAVDMEVRLIGCQMTMDVFGFAQEDFIEGTEIGGAATFLEFAADADISLFV